MKKLTTLVILLLTLGCSTDTTENQDIEVLCDNGTYYGDLFFRTQEQVDSFGELCYTKIEGTVFFGTATELGLSTDITNLGPLLRLTEIDGHLALYDNRFLSSLHGLHNLTKVSGQFHLVRTNALTSLQGLDRLTSSGTLYIYSNRELETLNGLNSLTQLTDVRIGQTPNEAAPNPKLSDYCALQTVYSNGSVQLSVISNNAFNPSSSEIISGSCFQ